ncbi:MAG: hypothetical protein N2320_04995 [Candidatus Bipolaricaulota bacterium]|nr:hypothetical protein [Candidatus Bipolaricaulota bacterium]
MTILLKWKGQRAKMMDRDSFSAELDLQELVSDNPDLLLIGEIKEGAEFLVLDKETPTRAGPIDLLGVDSDGELYIVETKLFRNPDKRKVLAQVLDYGAALWSTYEDPEAFLHVLDQRIADRGRDLAGFLEDRFGQAEEVLAGMKETISSGEFRFVILMDEAPSDLKDLVRYVNRSSAFSVYLIELHRYHVPEQGLEVFVPKLFGEEVRKEVSRTANRQRWDEGSFFRDLEQRADAETVAAVRKIYEYSKARADVIGWGTGAGAGSFNPRFLSVAKKSIYTVSSTGRLTFNFVWLTSGRAKAARDQLWTGLKAIPQLTAHVLSPEKSPRFPAEEWVPVCDQILELLDRVLADVPRESASDSLEK